MPAAAWWRSWTASRNAAWPVAGCITPTAPTPTPPGGSRRLPLVLARRCGLGRLLRRTVDRHFYAEHAPDETWPCDWLSGCFLMVRREAIEAVGRFDEGYGKYFEDVDLCLRMARAGWQVMYHGAASCYHLEAPRQPEPVFGRRLDPLPPLSSLAPPLGPGLREHFAYCNRADQYMPGGAGEALISFRAPLSWHLSQISLGDVREQ